MTTPQELAARPAGDDQVERAREIVEAYPNLQESLTSFVASRPTRGQMTDFLASLRAAVAGEQLKAKVETICRTAGIEQPSGAERLMAMQIGLLQEQNSILASGMTRALNQMRADAKTSGDDGFTALLGGLLLGTVLTRS
jgi:hypothetical protein